MELSDALSKKTVEEAMTGYRQKQAKPTIRKIGGNQPYLEARKIAKRVDPANGLVGVAYSQQILVDSDEWKRIPADYFPAWQREILVYPPIEDVFKKGKDVIDRFAAKGFDIVYPSYCIPEEARRSRTALLVDPKHEPVVEGDEILVIADPYKEVTILEDFPQTSGWHTGKVDKATGIPLACENIGELSEGEKASFRRVEGISVGPVTLNYNAGERVIDSAIHWGNLFGVGVKSQGVSPRILTSKITLGQLIGGLQ
jgi:hypothetical protein